MKYVKTFESFNSNEYLTEGILGNVFNWMKEKVANPIIDAVKNWKSPSIAKGAEIAKGFIEKNTKMIEDAITALVALGKEKLQMLGEKLKSFSGDEATLDKSLVKAATQATEVKNESKLSNTIGQVLEFLGLGAKVIGTGIAAVMTLFCALGLLIPSITGAPFILLGACATVAIFLISRAIQKLGKKMQTPEEEGDEEVVNN